MIPLVDYDKVGTLILGYYRNGTHFLKDVIVDQNPDIIQLDEVCNDNTLAELERLTDISKYKICILNNTVPKFFLASRRDLLQKWHVINLTRNDKVHHFISHWFWMQNTIQERFQDTGQFRHHNTDHDSYKNMLVKDRSTYDIQAIVVWLQEQLINYYLDNNATVDYSELPSYATDNIKWQPNKYGTIDLIDIFDNHKEIEDLLGHFTV
jgi:hypothetical protein